MKKYLDIMIDTETLSRRPNAAIIQIAAKPFRLDGGEVKNMDGYTLTPEAAITDIDAASCAMYGMDFDKDTVQWWSKNKEANDYFKQREKIYPIGMSLNLFTSMLDMWKAAAAADELIVWSQGTDFDIALLREAYRVVFGSEDKVPWKYRNVRDARTYFLEAVRLFAPDVAKPYDLVKADGVKHTALADVDWSIKAVQWAYDKYSLWNKNFGKEGKE